MTVQELCDRLITLSHQHGLAQSKVIYCITENGKTYAIKDVLWMPDDTIALVDENFKVGKND